MRVCCREVTPKFSNWQHLFVGYDVLPVVPAPDRVAAMENSVELEPREPEPVKTSLPGAQPEY